jgi:hypothetical protein
MENIPEVEKKETEMSAEDKLAEIVKLGAEFSEEQIKEAFKIKDAVVEKPVEKPETTSTASELSPETTMIAQTLMSTAEQKVKGIYADSDYSGILNAPGLNLLQKVTLMETVAVPNAVKMATIEKNLKGNDAEGTQTETKAAEFSKPSDKGKVDEKAGEKLLTEMSAKLGFDIDEKENSE